MDVNEKGEVIEKIPKKIGGGGREDPVGSLAASGCI